MGIYTRSLCQHWMCKFMFVSVLFCHIILVQRGVANSLWPRDTYGEYTKVVICTDRHYQKPYAILTLHLCAKSERIFKNNQLKLET